MNLTMARTLAQIIVISMLASSLVAKAQGDDSTDALQVENFFDDESESSESDVEQPESQADDTSATPLPVPEPETPADEPEESPVEPAEMFPEPAPAGPDAEPDTDAFSEEIVSDDVEPAFQAPDNVGEELTPFDEDPEIQFLDPEEAQQSEASNFEDGDDEASENAPSEAPAEDLAFEDEVPAADTDDDLNISSGRTRIRKGETKIRHPLAPRGLIRITKDKTYVYRTTKSVQDRAIAVKAGLFEPTQLQNPDTGTSFSDSYQQTRGPIAFFEYEWNWLKGSLGRIGYKLGSGLFTTQGNGQFEETVPENGDRNVPKETFTFAAFTNSASVVYRFQLSDKQTIVPYLDGGVMAITFFELRDDQDFPKTGLAPAAFFSGGLAFSLESLDSLAILGLDREYGINDIYFTAELRQIVNVGSDYDFTAPAFNGGFLLEF
ncbi:MAG: hypothetical protein HRT45_18770 [Bdellovibrionales bacterium]|nr:hypothetical protein [Bdellovibrionales bacterium]